MPWGIGYTICTALAIIAALRAMRYQSSRGKGSINVFTVGILVGHVTGACAMALMVIIATPGSQIEKIEPPMIETQPAAY